MGKEYLIDSNVIIDYAGKYFSDKSNDFVEEIFNTNFFISVAAKIEVLGFNDIPDKMALMEEFIDTATIFPLNDFITKQTISLRRNYKKLKLGDAIIAATAITHNLTLLSRNTKDFANIDGLQVLNPHEV
jgi:predicted nucleic acid-binding protein